jgi:glutamate-1-semialdehyde 2,1-aminomutase
MNNTECRERAHKYIPAGAHTYSKGDDQFPSNAPPIIDYGKGCNLWDMNGDQYTDFAMSLGTVTLGHAYEPVLEAVRKELSRGVNFTRPSCIEGELAELISENIPSAEMVKFSKHGSDATTAAIKLSRAATGREYIVRCSNDPFNAVHDWFIGSTVVSRGVPKSTQELTLQFEYNNLDSLQRLFDQYPNQIACVLLEPLSFIEPKDNFLEKLKALCEKNGTILIFDEVVSGFRFAIGGAQEITGVQPHLSAYGKAMANGFSVSALVGKKEIMELGGTKHDGERVFLLSTTHGGETHSLAASIATINEIKKHNIIKHFWDIGKRIQDGLKGAAEQAGISHLVSVGGYSCKPSFGLLNEKGEACGLTRTLFLQETCKRGILIPYIVPSFAHTPEIVDRSMEQIFESFKVIKKAVDSGDMRSQLEGHIIKPVFRKFN